LHVRGKGGEVARFEGERFDRVIDQAGFFLAHLCETVALPAGEGFVGGRWSGRLRVITPWRAWVFVFASYLGGGGCTRGGVELVCGVCLMLD